MEGDQEHVGLCLVVHHNTFLYTLVLIVIYRITEVLSYFNIQTGAPLMWVVYECINMSTGIYVCVKRLCASFSLVSKLMWHLNIVHFMRKVLVPVSIRDVKLWVVS
jgi:hypothetical protein